MITYRKELQKINLKAALDIFRSVKFGYSKKATKFEKIFHLKFDATQ